MMGGEIWVESEYGKGSRFIFTVELGVADMEVLGKETSKGSRGVGRSEAERETLAGIRGARILVVEDNEINQQVAREILEQAGLSVSLAADGREAVNAVRAERFDVVLMDVQMPVMDGYAATREIRRLGSEARDVPIIAMTAHAMVGDVEKSLEAGMNDHVSKPIDPAALFGAMVKYIEPGERTSVVEAPVSEVSLDEESLSALVGINVDAGLARLGGNRTLYRNLLLQFRRSQAHAVHEIREAFAAGDMEVAGRVAHTLKGVAGNIGADDVQVGVLKVESAVKQGRVQEVESLLVELGQVLAPTLEAIAALETEQQTASAEEAREVDVEVLQPLVSELAALLRENDLEAGDRVEAIKRLIGDAQTTRLEEFISQYDFDGALDTLTDLAQSLGINLEEQIDG